MRRFLFFLFSRFSPFPPLAILRHAGYVETFLKRVLTERIHLSRLTESNDLTNIMRDNSLTVLLIAAYSKIESGNYLRTVLGPVVDRILATANALEVNPNDLPEGQSLEENQRNLAGIIRMLLERIWEYREDFPPALRSLCAHMRRHSDLRLLRAQAAAAGGIPPKPASGTLQPGTMRLLGCFIFLRFIGPAIAAPSNSTVHDGRATATKEQRRALILSAKALNNLAADSLRVQKEDAAATMADLLAPLSELMQQILLFFSDSQGDAQTPLTPGPLSPTFPDEGSATMSSPDVPVTHEIAIDNVVMFLKANMKKIEDQLSITKPHLQSVLDQVKDRMEMIEQVHVREEEAQRVAEESRRSPRKRGKKYKGGDAASASMSNISSAPPSKMGGSSWFSFKSSSKLQTQQDKGQGYPRSASASMPELSHDGARPSRSKSSVMNMLSLRWIFKRSSSKGAE